MPTTTPQKQAKQKYFRVKFAAKSNPQSADQVTLGVNGELVVVQREKEVVLPEKFLEAADNATVLQYKQLPGEPRKIVGKVQTFPYVKIGEASEAEYLKMKSEGTKALRDSQTGKSSD